MAFHAYQFNFRQVKACVTTWRKPRRRWTEKNRFNNRKGVSSGAVFFERSLVRSLSRQQQALSLSSCEAELYGFAISVSRLTAELAELRELSVLQQVLTQGSSIPIVDLCCSEHLNLRKVCEVFESPIHWCSC